LGPVALHLIKLCVGCDTVEELLAWRKQSPPTGAPWTVRTRQTPKRAPELVLGGSLYRVYRGFILSRQRILSVDTIGEGASRRCEVALDEDVVRTVPTPRRAFQGWRYLETADAPPDLGPSGLDGSIPSAFALRLRELGVW
jgi:hypothetical protein